MKLYLPIWLGLVLQAVLFVGSANAQDALLLPFSEEGGSEDFVFQTCSDFRMEQLAPLASFSNNDLTPLIAFDCTMGVSSARGGLSISNLYPDEGADYYSPYDYFQRYVEFFRSETGASLVYTEQLSRVSYAVLESAVGGHLICVFHSDGMEVVVLTLQLDNLDMLLDQIDELATLIANSGFTAPIEDVVPFLQ